MRKNTEMTWFFLPQRCRSRATSACSDISPLNIPTCRFTKSRYVEQIKEIGIIPIIYQLVNTQVRLLLKLYLQLDLLYSQSYLLMIWIEIWIFLKHNILYPSLYLLLPHHQCMSFSSRSQRRVESNRRKSLVIRV